MVELGHADGVLLVHAHDRHALQVGIRLELVTKARDFGIARTHLVGAQDLLRVCAGVPMRIDTRVGGCLTLTSAAARADAS